MDKFTIVFHECEEGGYSAFIKEVPGATFRAISGVANRIRKFQRPGTA
jgi:predicted RNase H-like HicB family nuclease